MPQTASNTLIELGSKLLKGVCESPRMEAEILLAKASKINRIDFYKQVFHIDRNQEKIFNQSIELRSNGMPMAYILGKKDFWSLTLHIDKNVLIPRPESEHLVERALKNLPEKSFNCKILELGTGSGAIAISLAKERPNASVIATDISKRALSLAQHNALENNVHNIEFIVSDWFQELKKMKFNSIVVNPPYIDQNNKTTYDESTLKYEPEIALFAKNKGRESIFSIIKDSPYFLEPAGSLIIEHGFDQSKYCQGLMQEFGLVNIMSTKDYNGHIRITEGFLKT